MYLSRCRCSLFKERFGVSDTFYVRTNKDWNGVFFGLQDVSLFMNHVCLRVVLRLGCSFTTISSIEFKEIGHRRVPGVI